MILLEYKILLLMIFLLITVIIVSLIQRKKKVRYLEAKKVTFVEEVNETELEMFKQKRKDNLEPLPFQVRKVEHQNNFAEPVEENILPKSISPMVTGLITAFYPVVKDYQKFKVVFSPEMMEKFKDGTAKLMQAKDQSGFRAIATSAEGKSEIFEHATLIRNVDVGMLLNASFQVASVIVAQQHLKQINQSLRDINRSLENISEFLKDEILFHAKGNIEFYEIRVIPHFKANGGFDPVIKNQAEVRFTSTIDKLPHLLHDQEKLLKDIKNATQKNSVMLGKISAEKERFIREIKDLLKNYSENNEIILIYFRWLNEMYVPFLYAAGYSNTEIKAIKDKVAEFEKKNQELYDEVYRVVHNWTNSFTVKAKVINIKREKYVRNATKSVNSSLPSSAIINKPVYAIDHKDPLEITVEYKNNEVISYLDGN